MALIDELKERLTAVSNEMDRLEAQGREIDLLWKEQERLFGDLDTAILALDPSDPPNMLDDDDDDDLDTAIAALEPAPEIEAPAQPPSAELRSDPGSEENAGTNSEDPYSIDWGNEPISQPADQSEEEPAEFISDLTGDPAIEPESGPHGEPEPTELDAPASIVDDPELQAAVARAEQALAIDAQTCEPIYPHPQPAYVGLQDADLDADYDAMREREKAGKPKLHFSIFGKREDA